VERKGREKEGREPVRGWERVGVHRRRSRGQRGQLAPLADKEANVSNAPPFGRLSGMVPGT